MKTDIGLEVFSLVNTISLGCYINQEMDIIYQFAFSTKHYLLHNKQCGKFSHINNNWTTIIKIQHALYPLFLF